VDVDLNFLLFFHCREMYTLNKKPENGKGLEPESGRKFESENGGG